MDKSSRLKIIGAGKTTAGSHLHAALALSNIEVNAPVDPVADHFMATLPFDCHPH